MFDCWDYWHATTSVLVVTFPLAVPATFRAEVASFKDSDNLAIQKTFWAECDVFAADWTQGFSIKVANAGYCSA